MYSSEAKAWAELGILLPKKQKWSKKNSTTTRTTALPILYLSNYSLSCLSFWPFSLLFQPPKTFPHVLHCPNLSKRRSEKFFRTKVFFFTKKLFIFFFSIFIFLIFFFFVFFFIFFFLFFVFEFFFSNLFLSVSILLLQQTPSPPPKDAAFF